MGLSALELVNLLNGPGDPVAGDSTKKVLPPASDTTRIKGDIDDIIHRATSRPINMEEAHAYGEELRPKQDTLRLLRTLVAQKNNVR